MKKKEATADFREEKGKHWPMRSLIKPVLPPQKILINSHIFSI
jgi:hypothetical protein